ncbi:MAG TPA: hypothetical protein VFU29_09180 [Chitinophagaceae bacterium]|nr:hypothetical protein [Chitinophagaceae bacterium]
MEQNQNTTYRKKFFLWGLGIISSITALRLILPKKKKSTLVKMLSQDGKLVEVDITKIKKTGEKVSDKEISTWVKNKPTF